MTGEELGNASLSNNLDFMWILKDLFHDVQALWYTDAMTHHIICIMTDLYITVASHERHGV